MDMDALQVYLGRAKYGDLSAKEFNEVAKLLESTIDDRIRRKCIVILGWDGECDHSALVAKFINSSDKFIQEAAVRFMIADAKRIDLCYDIFMRWFGDGEVDQFHRLAAVQLAGDVYRETQQPYILERLLHFMTSHRESITESAKDSLIEAFTPDYNDQTPEAKRFRASKPTIQDFIRLAEQILSQSKN
jgi:hypothetical protein